MAYLSRYSVTRLAPIANRSLIHHYSLPLKCSHQCKPLLYQISNHSVHFRKSPHLRAIPFIAPVFIAVVRLRYFWVRLLWRLIPYKYRSRLAAKLKGIWGTYMWRFNALAATLACVGSYEFFQHTDSVPYTMRRRFMYVPPHQLEDECDKQLQALLDEYHDHLVDKSHPVYQRVEGIVQRLTNVAYDAGVCDIEKFEVYIIDAPVRNAMALPMGQVIIFSPMIYDTDDKLGVLLGHEISHVIAQHTAEQLSRSAVLLVLDVIFWGSLSVVFPDNITYIVQEWIRHQFGDLLFELPFSRNLEKEADYIGLILASRAGFDISAAPKIWEEMADIEGTEMIEWFSTHPAHVNRIKDLSESIPHVLRQSRYLDLTTHSQIHQSGFA